MRAWRTRRRSKTTVRGVLTVVSLDHLESTRPDDNSTPADRLLQPPLWCGGVLPLGSCLLFRGSGRLVARMLAPAVHLLDGGSIDFPLVLRVITGPSQVSVGMALLIRTHPDNEIAQSGVVFHTVVINRELGRCNILLLSLFDQRQVARVTVHCFLFEIMNHLMCGFGRQDIQQEVVIPKDQLSNQDERAL